MSDVMEAPVQAGPSSEQLAEMFAAHQAAQRDQQIDSFVSQHGAMFGNDRNIGSVILDNLYATQPEMAGAATAEAVQNVLDQLRTETQQVIDQASNILRVISNQTTQKIDDVANAVADATGSAPTQTMTDVGPAPTMDQPPMPPVPPPPEATAMAPPPPEAAPPAPAPEAAPAPTPPPTDAAVPPAPLPPEQDVSDVRMKNIQAAVSQFNKANPSVPRHILSAVKGSFGR